MLIVGFGGICLDYLSVLSTFPKPDDKTRSRETKVQGGGDAANTITCLARLGVRARLISKVADDIHGKGLLEELTADGVDTSFLVVAKGGQTPFSHVIVDQSTRTRTCIFTPGSPLMEPNDVSPGLKSALEGATFVYFDARYTDTAVVVANEAERQNIPILLDAEKQRPGLDDLLILSDYVVCSAKFPKVWTKASSMPSALMSMLLKLQKLKFAIVTLGENGCLMLERSSEEDPLMEEQDADSLLDSLEQEKDGGVTTPKCYSSVMCFSNQQSPMAVAFAQTTFLHDSRMEGGLQCDSTVQSLEKIFPIFWSVQLYPSGVNWGEHSLSTSEATPQSPKVVKLKADGVGTLTGRLYLCTAEMIPPEELVDTTGAGDAFIGAILYALCMNMPRDKMLEFASTVAAAGCKQLGARAGLPKRDDPCLIPFVGQTSDSTKSNGECWADLELEESNNQENGELQSALNDITKGRPSSEIEIHKGLVSSPEKKIDDTETKYEETKKIGDERPKQDLGTESTMIKMMTDLQSLVKKMFSTKPPSATPAKMRGTFGILRTRTFGILRIRIYGWRKRACECICILNTKIERED